MNISYLHSIKQGNARDQPVNRIEKHEEEKHNPSRAHRFEGEEPFLLLLFHTWYFYTQKENCDLVTKYISFRYMITFNHDVYHHPHRL